MEINYHFGFSKMLHPHIYKYILDHNIPFDGSDNEDVVGVDIYASDPHWSELESILRSTIRPTPVPYHGEQIFSPEELLTAEWLRVRSKWRYGWSEPYKDFPYSHITFSGDAACEKCRHGLKQIAPFQIKKVPSWGRRHFFSLNDSSEHLFVSDKAKVILKKEGITGIDFLEVRSKNGDSVHNDINQLVISTVLSEGFIDSRVSNCKAISCQKCGKKRYLVPGSEKMSFQKSIFQDAPDVVKTGDHFGAEVGTPNILIRQNVYRTIVDNKLDRSLMFYAIDLL